MIYNELQKERKDKMQTSPQPLMVLHKNFIAVTTQVRVQQ